MIGSQVTCCTCRSIGLPSKSVSCTALRGDYREVAVGEEEDIPRVIQDRGHIRSHEVFLIAQADDRGRTVAPARLSGPRSWTLAQARRSIHGLSAKTSPC